MAILTTDELTGLRQKLHRWRIENGLSGKESKDCLNATLQAIEDWYQAHKADGSARIDTASVSYSVTYTIAEKNQMFQLWMELKNRSNSA